MATIAAQILPAGPIAPSYADILQQLRISFWSIYGSDANLADDSQDGQFLAVFAKAIDDANQATIAAYNSVSPATAQGVALSRIVKLNGLKRLVPTNSQVPVVVVGVAGTIITSGIVGDNLNLGTQWALPDIVTIPEDGEIEVTATCTIAGSTTAAANTLTIILTPTRDWQSVSNPGDATPGSPVESDAVLRQRQSVSTSLPAESTVEGLYSAIANISGVQRLLVYENDTDVTDTFNVPSHSISVVAEGGDINTIAETIAAKKPPGTGTYGDIVTVVFDSHGVPNTIRQFQLIEVHITVEVTIQPLAGYVSTTGEALRQAVADFLSALKIGEKSYLARLYSPANLGGVGIGETFVVTLIKQSRPPGPPAAADVVIAFNEAATCDLSDVTLTVL